MKKAPWRVRPGGFRRRSVTERTINPTNVGINILGMSRNRSAADLRSTLARLMGVHREYQPDLAIVLQRSQGTVSNKLTGRSAFTVDELDKLADHYGITTADLLSGVEVAVTKSLAAKAKGGSALPG